MSSDSSFGRRSHAALDPDSRKPAGTSTEVTRDRAYAGEHLAIGTLFRLFISIDAVSVQHSRNVSFGLTFFYHQVEYRQSFDSITSHEGVSEVTTKYRDVGTRENSGAMLVNLRATRTHARAR